MGAHVKASTLSDTHDVADIDALVGGRAYDKPRSSAAPRSSRPSTSTLHR
jgi:hypothetical protein